jgi:uncharacterized protein
MMAASGRSHRRFKRILHLSLYLLAVLSLVLATGCGGGDSATTTVTGIQGRQVTFTTEDGILLSGHLFGTGSDGIVLSHMYPSIQSSWYPAAKKLAAEGYLVLTYDFRGYGVSEGTKQFEFLDRDVLAACRAIEEAGATRVVLVGASMGGTASLKAAARAFESQLSSAQGEALRISVAGVATLSAPVSFRGLSAKEAAAEIFCPLLFIAAEEDSGADGALELERLSGNTGDLKIVSGSDHGTDLLEGSQSGKVYDLLMGFLKKVLPTKQ